MQIVVDGLLTSYERSGKGSAIVLLHGWGDKASGLHTLAASLSVAYDVIIPDLPGFGGTQTPNGIWDLDSFANFIKHFLVKLKVRHVFAFIGHSNGGAMAIRGIGRELLTADKLVLIASAGVRDQYNGRVKTLRYITKAGKLLTTPLPENIKRTLRRTVYDTVGSDMLVAEHLQETFKRIVTDDVQSDAAKITIPTLLIYGEDDRATPIRYGELFHESIENSTLVVLPRAGHFSFVDRPEAVIAAIQDFLK